MRLAGRVFRAGRYWAIEVPILDVYTQGTSKADAFRMVCDAIEGLADKSGFAVEVYPGRGEYFEIDSSDQATLFAFLLRRRRAMARLSLAEVARRLGGASRNAYARYEQGLSVPTIAKLSELLKALGDDHELVLRESEAA